MARIKLRRGVKANVTTQTDLLVGEPLWTTDRGTLHVATSNAVAMPVTPAIDDLTALASIDAANDLLIIHDADSTGQKEKKMTFQQFKALLNIPAASTDEKVAIVSGGAASYLGTTGSDGILRVDNSLTMTKDASNAFVTLSVGIVDGGTF